MQALCGFVIALLFGHIHHFADALQALALPIRPIADLQHVAASIAYIGLQHIFQVGITWVFFQARPMRYEASVSQMRAESVAWQQADGTANGVVFTFELAFNRGVLVPVVGVKALQCLRLGAFHHFGVDLIKRFQGVVGFAVLPVHLGLCDKRVSVLHKHGHGVGLRVGQHRRRKVALAFWQVGQPFLARLLPAHAGGSKNGESL